MSALLEVRGLVRRFGGLNAVDGVDLDVQAGEILSVIGPNGAGKTTLFNVVTGLYMADEGSVTFDGHNLVGLQPNQICALGIARTFQTVRLFPNMTVLENTMVGQHCRTRSGVVGAVLRLPGTRAEERRVLEQSRSALSFFGSRLASYRENQPAFVLSYANRRRLEIARAMATLPKLILLDEPTAGMNPKETQEMTHLIGKLRDERGFTIVVIEHDMNFVLSLSQHIAVLHRGTVIAEGPPDAIRDNPEVREAYLGKLKYLKA